MTNTFRTFEWVKKICNQRNADSNKRYKLWSNIGERSMQAIQKTKNEYFIGKNSLEEFTNSLYFSFLPEGWIEENIFDEVH